MRARVAHAVWSIVHPAAMVMVTVASEKRTMPELLALHRAARRIGVTSRWLRTEADAGRLPCLCADSRYLFDIEAVTLALSRRAAIGERTDEQREESRHA